MDGFRKDMRICLTPTPALHRTGETHAYFPALAACCGAIEYLGALSCGNDRAIREGLTVGQITTFAETYMPQPDYDRSAVRILWSLFRNRVAHYGITSGVWVDQHEEFKGRRLIWEVRETRGQPALSIKQQEGTLKYDPPHDCSYTHLALIRLAQLALDVESAALRLIEHIEREVGASLSKFSVAMNVLYPAGPLADPKRR
jgi:hypothetical protein